MGILGKDKDSDPGAGSGDGGTLGTPTTDTTEAPPGDDANTMVVSGGGVADTSDEAGATAAGERGLG